MKRLAIWTVVVLVVGSPGAAAAGRSALGLAATKTYWGIGVEAALPADAASGTAQDVFINSISCASTGNCSAVGSYLDGSGNAQGLLLTETAGKWGAGVQAVLPANAAAGGKYGVSIDSVSCASAGDCSAVGAYQAVGSGNDQGVLLTETAGTWATGVEAVPPANAATGANQEVDVYSVSCPSAGNCSAVGDYDNNGSGSDGLLLTETAGTWATGVEAALPTNVATQHLVALYADSCASAGNCAAVGFYFDSSDNQVGLLLTETDGAWTAGVEASLPANAVTTQQVVDLSSISCASAGNCSAVGAYNIGLDGDPGRSEALLLTETAGTWATGVEPALPGNSGVEDIARLSSVSCATAGACAAVGGYFDHSGNEQGLLLSEKAGSWSNGAEAALPANATAKAPEQSAGLDSVSCASVGSCSAVGSYDVYSNRLASYTQQGLITTETAGTWGAGVEAALPSNATYGAVLTSVSCPSAEKYCSAGGSYGVSMASQGLLMGSSATPPCLVPKLKGKSLSAAKRSIKAHDCSVGKVKHARSRTIKKGHVISQKPKPGTQLKHGGKINLVVSKGTRR
jgi:PASTA domain